MKMKCFFLSSLLLLSFPSFADWSKKCLNDCFSTGHDCKYCSWQCTLDDKAAVTRLYYDSPCPLDGYYNYNDSPNNNINRNYFSNY